MSSADKDPLFPIRKLKKNIPKLKITLNWWHVIEQTTSTEIHSKTDRQRHTNTFSLQLLITAATFSALLLFGVQAGWFDECQIAPDSELPVLPLHLVPI